MFAAGFAVLVTIYFWWQNIKGVHESSGKALRIMQITTVMVVILLIWCPLTILLKDRWHNLPPAPLASQSAFRARSAGLAQRHVLAADSDGGDHRRVRPLAAVDERI